MKKTGFTLAEILITLAVIGIVAAITLPGLSSNVNSRKVGPALAKAVNTLENVNHTALMEESENTLDAISLTYSGEKKSYLNRVAKYLSGEFNENMTYKDNTKVAGIKTKDGITYLTVPDFSTSKCNGTCVALSGSPEYSYQSPYYSDNDSGKLPNKKYCGKFYPIMIDTNGDKKPNKQGKDQFMVYVDFYGTVLPAGGQESVDYGTDNEVIICTASKNASYAARCTGSIADNGWEMRF